MTVRMRIVVFVFFLVVLAIAISKESFEVFSLSGGKPKPVGAAAFVEAVSYDGLTLKDGKLFDSYSLTSPSLQEKDCAT